MFLDHKNLLNATEVTRLVTLSRELKFVEGRVSNPANTTKDNLQADMTDQRYGESAQIVMNAFARSREFRDFTMATKIAPPLLARYEPGMKYGAHADHALMMLTVNGTPNQFRSDISCTVFLNDPAAYEGGELALHIGTRSMLVKGQPGDAFIYPSTFLHEVRPVVKGQRLVSITFIQSAIPDADERNTLYELKEIFALESMKMTWENRVRLDMVIQNLTRSYLDL